MLLIGIDPGNSRLAYCVCTLEWNALEKQKYDILKLTAEDCMLLFVKWKQISCFNLNHLIESCQRSTCPLHHSLQFVDKMNHFFNVAPDLEKADKICLEMQPVMGMTDVTNLILNKYPREKIRQISPNTRNAFFQYQRPSLGEDARLSRKRQTVDRVLNWCSWQTLCNEEKGPCPCRVHLQSIAENLNIMTDCHIYNHLGQEKWLQWRESFMEEHHDVSDSIYLIFMEISLHILPQWQNEQRIKEKQEIKESNSEPIDIHVFFDKFKYKPLF